MSTGILISGFCGNIIIDKYLEIKVVDYDYSHFIGGERIGNLARSTHPDDLSRLKDCVLNLKINETAEIGYKIMGADDVYHNISAKFFYDDEKSFELGSVHAMFIDVDVIAKAYFDNLEYTKKLETYLEMTDRIFFEYEKSEDRLIFYIGVIRNNRYLFDGSMEKWKEVCGRLPIVESDKTIVYEINDFMREDKGKIKKKIQFLKEAKEIMPTLPDYFCGKSISVKAEHVGEDDKSKVLGYMFAGQADLGSPDDTKEMHMDPMLNIYDKKTITYYARRQIEMGKQGAIALLDVDNFKTVNDTYGHMFGDEVLVKVASILKDNVMGKGVAGRIGGDEFMIVIDQECDENDIRGIFSSIRSQVKYEYAEKEEGYNITVSIGIAEYGTMFKNYDDAFKVADLMLYRAKQKGRNRYIIYTPDIHGDVLAEDETVDNNNSRFDSNVMSKDEFMLGFFEQYRKEKSTSLNDALKMASNVFKLDEILIYHRDFEAPKYYCVNSGDDVTGEGSFVNTEEFRRYYNGNGVAVVQHAIKLKDVCQPAYDYMMKHNYESMIVYRGRKKDFYIVFGKCDKKARKWEETDVSYLNFIGALLDMELDI